MIEFPTQTQSLRPVQLPPNSCSVLIRYITRNFGRKVIVRVQRARTGLTKKIDRTSIRHHPYVSSVHQPLNAEQYNRLVHFTQAFTYLLMEGMMINDESTVYRKETERLLSKATHTAKSIFRWTTRQKHAAVLPRNSLASNRSRKR